MHTFNTCGGRALYNRILYSTTWVERKQSSLLYDMLGKHEVNQAKCREVTPREGISSEIAHLAILWVSVHFYCVGNFSSVGVLSNM